MTFSINTDEPPISLAIAMDFKGPQPNHFGAAAASATPMRSGDFIGDTRQGGSCNADEVRFNPHCNGTHTESLSHVIDHLLPPHEVVKQPLMHALLVTVNPVSGLQEAYQPPLEKTDKIISKDMLSGVSKNLHKNIKALIIRTLPNDKTKKTYQYGNPVQPPFFSNLAMQWLSNHSRVEHLLVDFPSVDRLHDDGLLSNHRIFWNIEPGSHDASDKQHKHKTITEMIYVPADVADGEYLLDLQLPRLNLNAVPSNPLLYRL